MPRSLLFFLLFSLLLPCSAWAEGESDSDQPAEGPKKVEQEPDGSDPFSALSASAARAKALRLAITGLDRDDTVVRYALTVRGEGRALIAAGGATLGIGAAVAFFDLLKDINSPNMPYILSASFSLGASLLLSGLPGAMLGQRFLVWLTENGPAPSRMARLKLLRRWRLESLRVRRDTALIASAFLGVVAGLSVANWIGRDRKGLNAPTGRLGYNLGDAYSAAWMLAAAAGSAVQGLIHGLEYRGEMQHPHRLYAGRDAPRPRLLIGGGPVRGGEGSGLGLALNAGVLLEF